MCLVLVPHAEGVLLLQHLIILQLPQARNKYFTTIPLEVLQREKEVAQESYSQLDFECLGLDYVVVWHE